ncbi:MAG TPA: hypothetical protein VKY90_05345 [Candidatus Dormibacteraeota bacterium]|nr:hypothetical protein [Candidatus Dormibacteraeota bacterium]
MSGPMGGGDTPLNLIWPEITGRCQLECVHCYAASGPKASPGTMTERDWCRVIDQAATLGVGTVQLIGESRPCTPACRPWSGGPWREG